MYSTDVLDFGTAENGWLISLNAMVRELSLTFAFPVIISRGRAWIDGRRNTTDKIGREGSVIPDLPFGTRDFGIGLMDENEAPTEPPKPRVGEEESFVFDLDYTRYSILVDGLLTGLATFHIAGLPHVYNSRHATACSRYRVGRQRNNPADVYAGGESRRAECDQLGGNGRKTVWVFGVIFSAFAAIGKPYFTFTCNAGVAVLAFAILCCAKFPPRGSRRMYRDDS